MILGQLLLLFTIMINDMRRYLNCNLSSYAYLSYISFSLLMLASGSCGRVVKAMD